jgi:PAS domain S-box
MDHLFPGQRLISGKFFKFLLGLFNFHLYLIVALYFVRYTILPYACKISSPTCSESPPNEVQPHSSVVSPDLASVEAPDMRLDGMFSIPVIQPNLSISQTNPAPTPLLHSNISPYLAPAPTMSAVQSTSMQGVGYAQNMASTQKLSTQPQKRRKTENTPQLAQVHSQQQPPGGQMLNPQGIMANASDPSATSPVDKSGRQKSQAQIDRRRERNRILARRTRLRKKFFFESLQKEVMELQKENVALKEIVRTRMDQETSTAILKDCDAQDKLPDAVMEQCGDPRVLGVQDFNLMTSIRHSQKSFVITDPSLQDNPIVYASDGFLELTGYSRDQVLGRNCRFLQGSETNQDKVAKVSKAVANGEDVSVTFVNYTADGTAFWNKLFIAALRDAQNNIVNFIGVSVKVAGPEPGDPEAGKVISSDPTKSKNGPSSEDNGQVDLDAAVMAIEGAVEKAVASAPNMSTAALG